MWCSASAQFMSMYHPEPRPLFWGKRQLRFFLSYQGGQWRCICIKAEGISRCVHGRRVMIKQNYWAGFLNIQPTGDREEWSVSEVFTNNTAKFLTLGSAENFHVTKCNNGWCSAPGYEWEFKNDNAACLFNRRGPLCSECVEVSALATLWVNFLWKITFYSGKLLFQGGNQFL